MSATPDLAALRERIAARIDELLVRSGAIDKHLRGQDGRLDADFSDRVAYTEMDDVLEALDSSARTEIDGLRRALQRMETGAYTTCTSCGDDIAPARLQAVPTTTLCRDCAETLG